MAQPLKFRLSRAGVFVAIMFLLWFAVFEWNSFDFTEYGDEPCYSANHEYYITRHQTLWEKVTKTYPHEFGTAKLFDKTGKLLYEGKTHLNPQNGPGWLSNPNEVYFQGWVSKADTWVYKLPSSPGEQSQANCYHTKIE